MTKQELENWKQKQENHARTLNNRFYSEGMNAGGPTERSEFLRRVNEIYNEEMERIRHKEIWGDQNEKDEKIYGDERFAGR